jgi:hypothetical protein
VVETTGHGLPIARKLWDDYGWRRMYKRRSLEHKNAKESSRLGWDTNVRSKPQMIAGWPSCCAAQATASNWTASATR